MYGIIFNFKSWHLLSDRNETTPSTNPMTNVVYEEIGEVTNDDRNEGKNYNICFHLIYIIYIQNHLIACMSDCCLMPMRE